jgi:hypothetical protein
MLMVWIICLLDSLERDVQAVHCTNLPFTDAYYHFKVQDLSKSK